MMPVYEYKCEKCGKTTMSLKRFSDRYQTEKCECGGATNYIFSSPDSFKFGGVAFSASSKK